MLCLKESEQSYYAFLWSDVLMVTGNQMILNYDLMYRQESIWKTTKTKCEIMTCPTKIHYLIFWWKVNYFFESPFIIRTILCKYVLFHRMPWSRTIYNLIIVYKRKPCICHGQRAGMGQTYKISAGAPEIDRKWNDTYELMCRQESI